MTLSVMVLSGEFASFRRVEPLLLQSPEEVRRRHFLEFSSILHDLLVLEGVEARLVSDPTLPWFSRLTPEQQDEALNYLNIYAQVLEELLAGGHSLLHSCRTMALSFLNKAGLHALADVELHLKDDDYLAIYNLRQQMIFLSPNHLQLMSYSFEDLFCRPWMDLFRRNDLIERVLLSRAMEFAAGKRTTTQVNLDIPPHFITEVCSPEHRSATCRSKIYSPVFRDGMPAGFLSVNRGASFNSRATH